MDAAKILLKNCMSHTATIGDKTVRFVEGRGQTVSDREVIEYCQAQPDRFDIIEIKPVVPEPKQKTKEPESEVDNDDESLPDDDDLPVESKPATRGRRKRVKVE
jgi:hypothetical protein